MRLQRINYAEAIIETFFDGSDSDRTMRRIPALTHYAVTSSDPAQVTVEQSWIGASITMAGGAPVWVELTRGCDLNIEGFDRLLIRSSIPAAVRESVRVEVDGQWRALSEKRPGTDGPAEQVYPLSGRHLTGLSIRLEQDGAQDRGALYEWIGLSNVAREEAMFALKSEYPIDWPDRLLPEGDYEPHIGIFFGKEELDDIRRRVREEPLLTFYEGLRERAREYLSWEPEKDIGECIPQGDAILTRARDVAKKGLTTPMETLAFVGLVEKDADMMRMAVRMALSVSSCDKWTEGSVMGGLPGTIWHHRSFTEEIHCRACALVLDWAGGWLTEQAQELIIDAIIMKGLPRIESDFKRMEYIRGMNQGLAFSSGRIFGLLACAHYYPRYRSQVLEAEGDLREMIGNYIQPDGGTPEGPDYWSYTFRCVMPTLYVLSRFHGVSFRDFMTPELEKTSEQGLTMLSIVGDGGTYIPVNDARRGYYSPLLMAAFYRLTGKADFAHLMALSLQDEKQRGSREVAPDLFIMAPGQMPPPVPYVREGFCALPDLGQARIIRRDGHGCRVSLSFYTGLSDRGHYHMDKGSFVLETEEETLLCDRGVPPYSHPDMGLAHMPEYHNLLFPELAGGKARQKASREGAYLVSATYEDGCFEAMGDMTRCWDDARILKNTRRIVSDDARSYLIEDEMSLSEEGQVSFLLNTEHPCEVEGCAVIVHGKYHRVRIEPENWMPIAVECAQFGVNERVLPVRRIVMRAPAARDYSLKTRITVL